jgi:molecular chaperone DnaK
MSYAHADAVRVAELAHALTAGGFEPWWDDRLEVGDDWRAELRNRIATCDVFLCAISADAVESEWCRWELVQATALSKFIVPIVVRRGAILPHPIANLQYLDVSAGLTSGDAAKLVDRLARLKQRGEHDPSAEACRPRGLPARFVQPLPTNYRTLAQAYLRPLTPGMHLFAWPAEPQPDGSSVSEIVGIDFGTTTSSVATSREGVAVLIPNALGQVETPSAVAIDEDGTPLVGEAALMLLLRRPERGVMEVKRLFGRETARAFGGAPVLEVDGTSYRPTDLAAFVFRQLRRDAEAHLGAPVRRVVLAAPAHFDHSQLLALRQAAGLAALEVLRVIPEPVAACLGSGALIDTRRDASILVYDLGGGTFDVTVVEVGEGVFEVVALHGDTYLGGADFDRVTVEYCAKEFTELTGLDLRSDGVALMRLREAAERSKIDLSTARSTTVTVPFIAVTPSGALDLNVALTRTRYNELTHDLVARTVRSTRFALDDAGQGPTDLDRVVVVGRAARTPSVRAALEDLFGPRARAAPDHVVALGAAVQAGVLSGSIKDVLLLDVLSSTIRVQVTGAGTVPVLVRNTTVPTKHSVSLQARPSGPGSMLLRLLAGESSWADRGFALMELRVSCGAGRDAERRVKLTLDIDANCILHVAAEDGRGDRLASGTLGLRGDARAVDFPTSESDPTAERESMLPLYDTGFRLGPLPEAACVDVSRVRRWLARAAADLVLSQTDRPSGRAGKQIEQDRARCRQIIQELRDNPDGDLPGDTVAWSLFRDYPLARELLVDALEQRLGDDLAPLRYCSSIGRMAERLVSSRRRRPASRVIK